MKQQKALKIFAKVLMLTSLLLWILERVTCILSDLLGRWLYGNQYLQPVEGQMGDMSPGFNMDMYLSLAFLVLFVLGVVLYAVFRKSPMPMKYTKKREL